MRLARILLLGIIWLGSVWLTACGNGGVTPTPAIPTPSVRPSPQVGNGTGDIKIGLIAPLVGANSAYGTALRRGVLLALEDIKATGWIGGRKIVLIERDDQSDPDLVKQSFIDLVERERVVAIIGTASTEEIALAQMSLANAWRVPWITPMAVASKIPDDSSSSPNYIFRLAVSATEQIQFIANYCHKKGFSQIALVTENSNFGQEGRTALLAALATTGLNPLAEERYYPEQRAEELRPIATRLKSSGAKVLIVWGANNYIAQLRKLLNEVGYNGEIIGSDNLAFNGFAQGLGTLADNILLPQTFLIDSSLPRQQDFVSRYKKLFNVSSVDFPSGVAQSYDAARLLMEALKQPNTADNRDNLRAALKSSSNLFYEGIIKVYQDPWKNSSEALERKDLVMAIWRNGKLVKA